MRSPLAIGLCLLLIGCGERVEPLGRSDSRLVLEHASATFDPIVWRQGDHTRRGAMLASLLRGGFVGVKTRQEVVAALGPSECYVAYEDEPCYLLRLGPQRYQLEFGVNHSNAPGQIVGISLRAMPEPRPRQNAPGPSA